MLDKVRLFIERHQLLKRSQRYLVAVSGGADSVALLRTLITLGYEVEVCHCNFQLRGDESMRDERFVHDLCKELDIPFHLIHFDTRCYANLHQVSIEMAARELRYRYFEQLCRDLEIQAVCVAHHRDDLVETMLLNMVRGTGIHGMVGIRPSRPIRPLQYDTEKDNPTATPVMVLRPLLAVSRAEIEEWLRSIGQTYVTDSTNLIDDVQRNQLRLNILPLLRQLNPAAIENLYHTALFMGETEKIYDASIQSDIKRLVHDNVLTISDLSSVPSPVSLLYEWLGSYGFSSATIQQIAAHLDASTGRQWSTATHDLSVDRGRLLLTTHQEDMKPFKIPECGLYHISESLTIRVSLSSDVRIDRSPQVACLDADNITFPLILRPVQQADRFIPFGMQGSKLLSDFLTDQKLSLPEKRRQLVLTDTSGQILWVMGRRIAQTCAITPATTRIISIEVV